jgi:hypothetical protein
MVDLFFRPVAVTNDLTLRDPTLPDGESVEVLATVVEANGQLLEATAQANAAAEGGAPYFSPWLRRRAREIFVGRRRAVTVAAACVVGGGKLLEPLLTIRVSQEKLERDFLELMFLIEAAS